MGLNGTFMTDAGQSVAALNPDGSLQFDGNYLSSLTNPTPAPTNNPPAPPPTGTFPVDPNAGQPQIETFPINPEAGQPQVETFPANPGAGQPTIETFPADQTAGQPQIETFPVPDDLNDLNTVYATATPNANGGYDVEFKYRPDWTPEQWAEADAKVAALNAATPATQAPTGPRTNSAADTFRSGGGVVPQGSDVDHTIDLQLGGSDALRNMSPLDASVNRSLGAQLSQVFRANPGARIDSFRIGD